MANTLTDLIPDLYEGLNVVSRELTGFIPSVNMDNRIERAALNQTVRIPIAPESTSADNTPGVTPPDTGDQVIGNVDLTINKSKHVPIRWNGEQTKAIKTTGLYSSLLAEQTAEAVRTLVNEIEADCAAEYIRAAYAYGVAGTTPFGSDLEEMAWIKKLLDDNGADGDRSLVMNTLAGVNMRNLTVLNQANTAGNDMLLRQGITLPLFNISVKESAQVKTHTAGTAALATTDATGYAAGTVTITLASAGTGTILAGDVITFAGDTTKYIVVTGNADVSAGGTITIAAPGLKTAIPASATAITLSAAYTANMAFSRSSIQLATRFPESPEDGDLATDTIAIVDMNTGLTFEVAKYKQYLQNQLQIRIAWGVKISKTRHVIILLG